MSLIGYNFRTAMHGCKRIIAIGSIVLAIICFYVVAFVYFSLDVNRDFYSTMKRSRLEMTGKIDVENSACIRIEPLDQDEVPGNRSIFFIETTRRTAVEFTARQACSVESAARWEYKLLKYMWQTYM